MECFISGFRVPKEAEDHGHLYLMVSICLAGFLLLRPPPTPQVPFPSLCPKTVCGEAGAQAPRIRHQASISCYQV